MINNTSSNWMVLLAAIPVIAIAATSIAPHGETDWLATGGEYPGTGLSGAAGAWPESWVAIPAGLLDHAHAEPSQPVTGGLVHVATIRDGADGFTALDGPRNVATFRIGGGTYAAITSLDGVQIADVTDPANPAAVASLRDSSTRELDGARGIEVFEMSSRTYAIVTGFVDDGVQIIDVTNPRQPVAAGRIGSADLRGFDGPSGVAVFEAGGDLHAIVTVSNSNGVQIINIADPLNPAPAGRVQDNRHLELSGALGVDTFETGGGTYAVVVGYRDNGIQIINVTDPSAPTAAGSLADNADLELHHAFGVATFESGGDVYAAVAGYEDYGIQVINVTDPLNPSPAGRVNTRADGGEYSRVIQVALFEVGGGTYAVAPFYQFGHMHLVDLTDPYNPADLAHIRPSGYSTGYGIDVFEAGGSLYAISTALAGDDAYILRISTSVDLPPGLVPNPPLPASIQAGSTYEDAGATCIDGVDGNLTGQIRTVSTVNSTLPGNYTVTYACADSAGNEAVATRAVTVTGSAPVTPPDGAPTIVVAGANPAEVAVGDAYADAGAACTDDIDGDLTGAIRTTSYVNVHAHGNYTVTYACADSEGNEAVATRTVVVIDADAPRIAPVGHSTVRIYVGDAYTDAGATCIDRVDGDLSDYIAATDNIDTAAAGRYEVTYSCADSAGNEAVAARTVIVLDHVYTIADGVGNYTELEGASGVEVFERGGRAYAVVAASGDNGVQLIDITDPNRPAAAGNISDGPALNLDGASDVEVFERGGRAYAVVAASGDDGVQVIDITDPNRPAAAGSISDGPALNLDGASDVEVFERGGRAYAVVAASGDDGVQVIDITDPNRPAAAGNISDGPALNLDGASDVEVFERGGRAYAVVAASGDDGVQVIDITDPNRPAAAGSLSGSRHHYLHSPSDVAVFERGGSAYAVVTAFNEDGIQVINVTDPDNLAAAGKQRYGASGHNGLSGITVFEDGGRTYAIITQTVRDGIRIVDITNPSGPVSRQVIHDDELLRLDGASDAATFRAGGSTYAIVTASGDDGAQIVPVAVTAAALTPPTITLNGTSPVRIEAGSTYEDAGAACADDIDGDLTDLVRAISTVDAAVPGNYTVTYTCTDSVGAAATAVREVVVEDTRPPTLLSAAYIVDNGTLRMIFSEPLNSTVHWDRLHIRDAGESSGGVAPDGVPGSAYGATLTTTLAASQMATVGNLTTPQLDIDQDAVADLSGNGIAAAPDQAITLHERNLPPTIQTGPDRTVTGGQNATLTGTATDPDGDRLAYLWTHDRPALGIILANATSPSTTFTAPEVSSNTAVTFTLTATDDRNATSADQVTITVTRPNDPPSVDAGPDRTVYPGQTVALTGTATDQDDDPLAYLWSHDSTLGITITNATSPSTIFAAPRVPVDTTIAFTLTVHDGTAAASDSLNVTVTYVNTTTVWTPDQPPGLYGIGRISLASEAPGTIQATWEEPDRDPVRYRISWAKVGEPYRTWSDQSANAFPTEPTHTITGLEGGQTYKVAVRADYNGSAGPWSGDAIVAVAESANNPPTVDAGADRTVTGGQNATLTGTATDPDGDDLAYLWTHDRPALGITLANATSPSTTFTAPEVAANTTLTFTLTATDTHNATASDSTDVTIAEAPEDPPAAPVQNITAVLEAPVPRDSRDIGRITLTSSAPGTILAAWEAPAENPANYRIAWAKEGEPFRTWTDRSGNAYPVEPAHTMTGLEEGAEYRVMVRASYAGTAGDWSGELAITVASASPPAVPGAPQNLRATPTHDSVVLAWDRPDDDSITGYKILSGSAADHLQLSALVNNTNSTDTTYTVEGLQPSTAYVFGVAAVNEHGESGPSEPVSVSTAAPASTHFVTTWRTSSANESIMIPVGGATGTYTVDWGDGTVSANVTGNQRHAYGTPGTHTVRIYGDFTRIHLNEQQPNAGKLRSIEQWGDIRWESMNSAFQGASNMVYRAADAPDLSGVTDTSWMFYGATSFNGNISSWDVSAVTDMRQMFHGATSFNQDLSSWDVSAVTDMAYMFFRSLPFNGNISTWNTSAVTDMHSMFGQASSFNQDLSTWDVSAVTDMSGMFSRSSSFNGNISSWDVSAVTNMRNMFSYASSFNQDISSWDVSAVTDTSGMFYNVAFFNRDLSSWDVSAVTDTSGMFDGATLFNQDISSWNVSAVTDMSRMFSGSTLFNQDISGWDVSAVTDTSGMFYNARYLNQDISGWDVSSVTDMSRMFDGAFSFEQNLGPWYVTPGTVAFDAAGDSLNVAMMTAQNQPLRGHDPAYRIETGGDSDLFEMVPGSSTLAFKNIPTRNGTHTVNVTASGPDVFGSGLNHVVVNVTVTGAPAGPPEHAFVTTWTTTSANQQITLPVSGSGMAISWGDGQTSSGVSGTAAHTYENAGTYTVSVTGGLTRMDLGSASEDNAWMLASIEQWGNATWTTMEGAFRGASSMTYNAADAPDLSAVVSMHRMFGDAYSFDGDLSSWNTSAVTDMSDMFALAFSFDGDISSWNVSAVTDMSGMFQGTFSFDQDLSTWNVSAVTDMNRMFSGADLFDQDLSGWDVSAVTDMSGMFDGAASFDGDVSTWDVSAVTNMESMFAGAASFDGDLSTWDVSAATDMTDMFYDAFSFDQDISGWDVSGVTEMSGMFAGAASFNGDTSSWDVSAATDMTDMFYDAFSFDQDISGWDVSAVTDMSGMFDGAESFEQNLGPWYITLDTDSPTVSADDRLAGNIGAQNAHLSGHNPIYNVTGEHAGLFEVAGGALRLKDGQNVTAAAYQVTVAATGDGLFGSGNRLVVPVAAAGPDVNAPPTVQAGPDQAVTGGDTVTLTGTAADPNNDRLAYLWSHDSSLNITLANTTSISTTFAAPEVSANTTITFTLTVTDAHNATASDSTDVTILLGASETEVMPALAEIHDQTVSELSQLTFVANVTNGHLLAAPLTYGLEGAPEGASMDPATGEFEWIPTEIQNGGHAMTVTVSDQDGRTGSQDLVIMVREVNAAPVLDVIPDQIVNASSTLTFAASAADGDRHPGVETEVVAKNLRIPWSIDWLPDGTALFTERGGKLRMIQDGLLAPDPLLSLDVSGGEGGLLGIAVDPDFGENHHIYLYYSTVGTNHAFINKVVRYQFANGTVTEDRVLIDGIPGARYHDGGRIQFGPDGYLYVTTGDASVPALAQSPDSLAGKILRIDRDGGIPADNPFANSPVWSTGHRNSQGIDWDEHGNLVASEHGPSGGWYGEAHDEINVIVPGANYGWPVIVGGRSADGMTTPILHTGWVTWAPSGAEFYHGEMIPGWTGKYFVAALKGAHLHMVDLDIQNDTVVSHQRLFQDEFGRLRDVQTGPDGYLYLLTSNRDGRGNPVSSDDRIIRVVLSDDASRSRPANTLTYGLEGAPEGASIDPASGAFVWEPTDGRQSGTATFNVTVSDGRGGTDAQPVRVHVIKAPDAPQNLRATPAHDSVVLAWDRPDDDSITGYKILSGSAADPSRLSALVNNTNSTDTTYTVEGLQPSTAYVFGVAAVNEHGESGPSEPVGVSTAAFARTHFVTTWRTSSANESIMIPVGDATGTYTVDWGDGTVSANVTGNQRHAYGTPGTHTVEIYGDFTRIHLNEQQPNAGKLRSIEQWGDIRWESMNSAFQGASNMVYRATDAPDLSGVTDTSWMFYGATSFNGNISSWDVSAVTNMYKMLHAATSFNQDLSSWDVSAVTNMAHMFSLATSFNGDISTWNTSAVTDMHGTFSQATSFNQDLSSWDVSSVTDMHSMFPFATSFNGNISTWDVSAANDMRNMFSHATSFNQDLSSWDVSAVTDMSQMFRSATSFNQDLSSWDVSSVTDMNRMFWDATSFNQDVSGWDVAGVTNMRLMFWDATSFNQDVSGWDVAGVTNMHQMFYGADSFEQNLGPWYVVLDTDSPAVSADDRLAGNIRAQNAHLSGHNPIYDVTGEHASLFEVAGGALRLKDNQNVTTTTYQVTVAATGDGLFGSGNHLVIPVDATEPDANTPPAAPQNLRFGAATNTTVTLTWDDPDNAAITGYKILSRTPATQAQLAVLVNNTGSAETAYTVRNLEPETAYVFRVIAVNDHGESGWSNFVRLSTAPTNAPPAVQAGPDRTIPEGDTVTLTGTATDPDGDHLTYLWTHDQPALDIALDNATSVSTTFTAPEVSSNTTVAFTLTATDTHNATASDRVEVTIAQVNAPPAVQAGPDRTIPEGDTVTLTGTATDPDGDHLTYLWTHDQPALEIAFANSTAPSTTLTAPQVTSNTTLTLTLTADDGTDTSSDTLALTITDIPAASDALPPPSSFVTTWRTSAANESITIPVGGAAGTYTVYWGDGTVSTDVTGDQTHTYVAAGTYTVSISGDFARIHLNGDANAAKLRSIDQWGDTQWESMEFAFEGASSMVYRATDSPDLSGVTSMRHMFHGASSFNGDISSWDVSSVTNMIGAFREAASFNGDISSWDVSTANDMRYMFRGASSFNQDLSFWDVSAVIIMTGMFHGASSFNGDISTWDVSSATDMRNMFQEAASFNQDLSFWDVSAVTTMVDMFRGASSFNQDLSTWDVSAVTTMVDMFRGASSFNQDLSSWDVSAVTTVVSMFREATSFNGDVSSWDVSSATDMRNMFRGASSFNQDLSSWDVSSATDMRNMFRGASSFNQDLSSWDVSSATDMRNMFRGASSFNQDLSSWDVSSATDMGDMFRQADSFAQNLGRWYITLDDTTISSANETLAISAQNAYLDGQNPTYSVADARFAVAGGALAVNPDQTPQPGSYNVTISSAGGFGTDNARVVEITVDLEPTIRSTETVAPTVNHTGQDVPANRPPTADAGPDRTVNEGSTVVLNGTAADPDGDTLTYLWTSEQPGLSISGNDTLSASFTAPQVASNTTITFTLTVSDGTNAAVTDQVRVAVTDQVQVAVTEVPPPGSPPDAPQNLQATSTNTDITLTWNPANDDSITGYKILSRTPYTQTELSVLVDDTGSADTSYLVRNLDPDTVYVFRVIAINEHGESGWSNFVRLSTLP